MIRDEKGQSLVELALVIPLLLLLVIGIFDIGRMLYTYSDLHFTTQETARMGAFGKADTDVIQFAEDNFHAGNSSELRVKFNPENQSLRKSGDYVTVTLEYPIKTFIPFISKIFKDPILLSSDSTIRIE